VVLESRLFKDGGAIFGAGESSFSDQRDIKKLGTFVIQFPRAETLVTVQVNALATLGSTLASRIGPTPVLVISDETVAPLYADPALAALRGSGFRAELAVVPPGDASKSLARAAQLYDRLAQFGVARDGLVLALGGGMVSDLAGFVAATWMRGIAFAICPTTLEAAIDASIGGKTAVNHSAGKNLIGAFHQPTLVHIDPRCLRTLEPRDWVAGMAESIKHAAIADEPFLTWHEQYRDAILAREPELLVELIERNVRIKADVVSRDEREQTDIRAALNFGHTIGHAIEAARGYELRHGECVALGMVAACRIGVSLGLLDAASGERVIRAIESFGLPIRLADAPRTDELLSYMARDKKIAAGRIRFTLLDGLGKTVLRDDVPERVVLDACESLIVE
jgi:3-dehydroquinate synthase